MKATRNLIAVSVAALALAACAVNMGGPRDIPYTAVALRPDPGASPQAVAASLIATEVDAALVAGSVDSAWLATTASVAGLTVSGPGASGDLALAFLAGEPLGDTTVVLPYDGGRLIVHDALYEVDKERLVDLMIFRLEDPAAARPAVAAFLQYMATDVSNSAAVILAVATPTPEVADSVGRMLRPAYFDALRCSPGLEATPGPGIRLFYGPEARVYCNDAGTDSPGIGPRVRAGLTLGRR